MPLVRRGCQRSIYHMQRELPRLYPSSPYTSIPPRIHLINESRYDWQDCLQCVCLSKCGGRVKWLVSGLSAHYPFSLGLTARTVGVWSSVFGCLFSFVCDQENFLKKGSDRGWIDTTINSTVYIYNSFLVAENWQVAKIRRSSRSLLKEEVIRQKEK